MPQMIDVKNPPFALALKRAHRPETTSVAGCVKRIIDQILCPGQLGHEILGSINEVGKDELFLDGMT